jgi:putative redox protein
MSDTPDLSVVVSESGNGPYAQFVTAGRHVMGADEPEHVGGHDTGPSPYEFLMAALGSCTAMTVRMYANRHGWPVEKISVALKHERVPAEGGLKADKFTRAITVTGALDEAQRKRLLEIAEHCPVSQTLRHASLVDSRLT